jgi:hypothetical protein
VTRSTTTWHASRLTRDNALRAPAEYAVGIDWHLLYGLEPPSNVADSPPDAPILPDNRIGHLPNVKTEIESCAGHAQQLRKLVARDEHSRIELGKHHAEITFRLNRTTS